MNEEAYLLFQCNQEALTPIFDHTVFYIALLNIY